MMKCGVMQLVLVGSVVFGVVATTPGRATANTCSTTCTVSKCTTDCDDDAQYVIFGTIWKGGAEQGVGVCWFNRAGTTFVGWTANNAAVGTRNVNLLGEGDLIRVSGDWEYCGDDGGASVYADNSLPANNAYYFYGGAGGDYMYLSSRVDATAPGINECFSYGGTASGEGGDDYIYGSYYADTIYGDDGDDHIWGHGGSDYLSGLGDVDTIRGGDGGDYMYGGVGDDTMYGETGCDYLWGVAGADTCSCEGSCPPNGGKVQDGYCTGGGICCGGCT